MRILVLLLSSVLVISCNRPAGKHPENVASVQPEITVNYSAIPEKTELPGNFVFPSTGFAYEALEPFLDAKTVYIHYEKHTRGYYEKFIAAITDSITITLTLEEIIRNISRYDPVIRKNGGQFFNHIFYWENLSPAGGQPDEALTAAILKDFGSFDNFRKEFEKQAATQFGSGWAWLALDDKGTLFVTQTSNEINPMMDISPKKGTPLLTIDVWEHAYYLKYQNKRPEYISAFWNIVNWNKVNERFAEATN